MDGGGFRWIARNDGMGISWHQKSPKLALKNCLCVVEAVGLNQMEDVVVLRTWQNTGFGGTRHNKTLL